MFMIARSASVVQLCRIDSEKAVANSSSAADDTKFYEFQIFETLTEHDV